MKIGKSGYITLDFENEVFDLTKSADRIKLGKLILEYVDSSKLQVYFTNIKVKWEIEDVLETITLRAFNLLALHSDIGIRFNGYCNTNHGCGYNTEMYVDKSNSELTYMLIDTHGENELIFLEVEE